MSHRVAPLAPRGLGNELAYYACRDSFNVLLRLFWRLSLADVRPLPEGPLIVAANHRSFLDPLVLGAVLDRRLFYMMHAKYYDLPALNGFFRMARCIVVESGEDQRAALRDAVRVLEAGEALAIFPEGHISPDGSLQPAQPGLAWIARKTGAPVYPLHLGGTREALRKGQRWLHLSHVTAALGDPLRVQDFPEGRAGLEAFNTAVMSAIARLGRPATRKLSAVR
ncbi:MAG: lysophospholipid acyltransferase family protein [Planctomycetota bacterium]